MCAGRPDGGGAVQPVGGADEVGEPAEKGRLADTITIDAERSRSTTVSRCPYRLALRRLGPRTTG